MSSQLTYYSDTQKNAAMIKFVENGLATMVIINNYNVHEFIFHDIIHLLDH